MLDATPDNDLQTVEHLKTACDQITAEIGKVIIGQRDIVDQLLIALLCGGHCLLVGVPGLAKTLLISTLARALDLSFSRIQFTPDLMPSDITGTEVLEEDHATGHKTFRFVKGPLFANIILADEINRTPPKTQAALLQAMQEHEVTAGGGTFRLEEPFFVLATQNPIEQEGTYPLPEAQLDRFIFNLWIDYPTEEEGTRHCQSHHRRANPRHQPGARCGSDSQPPAPHPQSAGRRSHRRARGAPRPQNPTTNPQGRKHLYRPHAPLGRRPRASQCLILGAKARAVLSGRFAPSIEDVSFVAKPVLRHRLVTSFNAEAEGITTADLIDQLLEEKL